jgi:hypothetical protein
MQHRRPLWLGVAFAPWAAPIALALLTYVSDRASGGRQSGSAAIEVLAFALALGLPLAYAGLVGLGLPYILGLRRRGRLTALRLLLLAGPLGSAALCAGFWVFGFKLALVAQIGLGAVMGLAVALAFCLICGIRWRAATGV